MSPAFNPPPSTTTVFSTEARPPPSAAPKTLPVGSPQLVRLAVFSCAAYSIGQFHAYADAVRRGGFDAALMLGDYIYETGLTAAEQVAAGLIGREADPRTRTAFALRLPAALRALSHRCGPAGAARHHAADRGVGRPRDHQRPLEGRRRRARRRTEGSFTERRAAAVQAFHEWLPTREQADPMKIYRSFDFGNLLALHMLDTRLDRPRRADRPRPVPGRRGRRARQAVAGRRAGGLAGRAHARLGGHLAGAGPASADGAHAHPAERVRRLLGRQDQRFPRGAEHAGSAAHRRAARAPHAAAHRL